MQPMRSLDPDASAIVRVWDSPENLLWFSNRQGDNAPPAVVQAHTPSSSVACFVC